MIGPHAAPGKGPGGSCEKDGKEKLMKQPPIVSPQEWQAAREVLLVKEKEHTRARDAPPYRWWNYHDAYGEAV